jgi:hypothetical protein
VKTLQCVSIPILSPIYGIEQVSLLEDMETEEDMVVLQSPECLMALEQYDIGIKMPNDPTLN